MCISRCILKSLESSKHSSHLGHEICIIECFWQWLDKSFNVWNMHWHCGHVKCILLVWLRWWIAKNESFSISLSHFTHLNLPFVYFVNSWSSSRLTISSVFSSRFCSSNIFFATTVFLNSSSFVMQESDNTVVVPVSSCMSNTDSSLVLELLFTWSLQMAANWLYELLKVKTGNFSLLLTPASSNC